MKRILNTIITITCVCNLSWSQFIIEPVIGMNIAWDNDMKFDGIEYSTGKRPAIGIGTRFEMSENFHFRPSAVFGYKGNTIVDPGEYKYSKWNTYLSLPLIFDWYFNKTAGVFFGITPGYWVSSKTYVKDIGAGGGNTVSAVDLEGQTAVAGHFNRVELALEVGIPVKLVINRSFTINLRVSYKHGIVPLFQPDFPQSNYHYVYNRWVQISLGIPFKINL